MKRQLKLWEFIAGAVLAYVVLFGAGATVGLKLWQRGGDKSPQTSKSSTTTKSETSKTEAETVFAWQVWNAYEEDPKAARQRFSDRTVRLVGHVWDVRKEAGDTVMYLAVLDNQTDAVQSYGVECHFKGKANYGELTRGEHVVIEGTCRGKSFGSVNFFDCKFVRKFSKEEWDELDKKSKQRG